VIALCGGIALGGLWGIVQERDLVLTTFTTIPSLTSRLYFISTLFPMWKPAVDLSLVFILIGSVSHTSNLSALKRYVVVGALLGAIVTVLQKHGAAGFLLRNQSSFWSGVDRLPGSFSDPNAQGVYLCCALIFGVVPLWRELRTAAASGVTALLIRYGVLIGVVAVIGYAALLGGSRSFFLGLGIWCALSVFLQRRSLIIPSLVVGVCTLFAATFWKYLISPEHAEFYLGMLPTGARRVLDALSMDRITETFFSRSVFLRMSWEALREYGVWGIGLNRFRYFSPALADAAGYDLGGWIDNANNFYLGLATEVGVLGAVVILATGVNRKLAVPTLKGAGVVVVTVLALLFTGPHIESPEVGFLYAVILGALTRQNSPSESNVQSLYGRSVLRAVALVVVCIGIGAVESSREVGVYTWEREGPGMHQWLAPFSRVSKACGCNGDASFNLEVAHASQEDPIIVTVKGSGGAPIQKVFSRPGIQRITAPCVPKNSSPQQVPYHYPTQGREMFTIVTSSAWSPKDSGSQDPRVFGVRLRDRRVLDLVGHRPCP
jgi:hypothetical protein